MAKRGRPKLAKGKVRRTTVSLRLSVQEAETLRAAAKRAGQGLSKWARRILLNAAQTGDKV